MLLVFLGIAVTDSDGTLLWTTNENIHHDLKFTADQTAFLVISGEVIQFNDLRHSVIEFFSARQPDYPRREDSKFHYFL